MPNITFNITITDEQVDDIIAAITGDTNAASTTPPPSIGQTGNLDHHGVPWHPEHHSSVKKLTTKGVWKRVRGGDKNACAAYEAQYINTPAPAEGFTVPPHIAADHPEADPVVPAPAPAPAPTMPMPAAAPVVQPVSYEMMVQSFQDLQAAKGEQEAVKTITDLYAEHGVENPEQVQTDETIRAAIDAGLKAAM